ncbi:MAG: hypothetical protein WC269_03635 [Candidatus Gracilibacteria bacterium]|jgi:flagellar basal body-associated protein FliL
MKKINMKTGVIFIVKFIVILALAFIIIPTCFGYKIPAEFTPSNAPLTDVGQSAKTTTDMANGILQTIAAALLYFAAPVTIAMLAFASFKMIMGGANSEEQEQGKKQVQWAVLGLLAVMLSYSIVRIAITFILYSAEQPAPPGA